MRIRHKRSVFIHGGLEITRVGKKDFQFSISCCFCGDQNHIKSKDYKDHRKVNTIMEWAVGELDY